MEICTQGSHRNLIIKFHDFSMPIYTVFHDAKKTNTEDHLPVFITHTKKEVKYLFNLKIISQKDGLKSRT